MTRSDDKPLLVSKSAKCGVKMQLCGVFRLRFVSRTNCFRGRVLLAEICHTDGYVQQQIDQWRPDTFPLLTTPSEHIIIGDAGRRLAFVQAQEATIGRDRRLRYNWAPRIKQDDQYSFSYVALHSSDYGSAGQALQTGRIRCVRDPAEGTCMHEFACGDICSC